MIWQEWEAEGGHRDVVDNGCGVVVAAAAAISVVAAVAVEKRMVWTLYPERD